MMPEAVAAHRRDALYCFWATFKFRAIFILVAKLKLLLGTCTDSLFFGQLYYCLTALIFNSSSTDLTHVFTFIA